MIDIVLKKDKTIKRTKHEDIYEEMPIKDVPRPEPPEGGK